MQDLTPLGVALIGLSMGALWSCALSLAIIVKLLRKIAEKP